MNKTACSYHFANARAGSVKIGGAGEVKDHLAGGYRVGPFGALVWCAWRLGSMN